MLDAFTRHPQTVGESYFQHLLRAWSFAAAMAAGALACLVHGVFPFAFERSASRRVRDLHEQMATRRGAGLSA
ncbi:MAG: DUF6356 family protein [Pseudomonadota bacterium]|jgi:hypothetical protein